MLEAGKDSNKIEQKLAETAYRSNNFNLIPPIIGIIIADQYGNTITVFEYDSVEDDKYGPIKSYLSKDQQNFLHKAKESKKNLKNAYCYVLIVIERNTIMYKLSLLKENKFYYCVNYAGVDPDMSLKVLHKGVEGEKAYAVFRTEEGKLLFLQERMNNLVFNFMS